MDRLPVLAFALAGLLLLAVLAGCTTPEGTVPDDEDVLHYVHRMDSETGCVAYVCQADPDDAESVRIREEYGYEKLTADDGDIGQGTVHVEGDWNVYLESHLDGSKPASIRVLQFPTGQTHNLIEQDGYMTFSEWDPGGEYVVLKMGLCYFRSPWLYGDFVNAQLYWIQLPEVA